MPPTLSRLFGAAALSFVMLYLISLHWLAGPFLAAAALMAVITAQKVALWLDERREWARLLDECYSQHAAWKAGDDDWGVYGISPIAETEPRLNDGYTPMDPRWTMSTGSWTLEGHS